MLIKNYELGTQKIGHKNYKFYIFKNYKWNQIEKEIPKEIKNILNKYIKNKTENYLIDEILNNFLKGSINKKGLPSGKRINILPNGKKLARGGFSIFAKNLKFNDNEKSDWDVVYENTSGTKTYLYNEDKIHLEHERKAKIVDKFSKFYLQILKNLKKDIIQKNNNIYLALYTMINTYIRIGNLEYYNHLGHKGLTTLQKKDIKIKKNKVIFDFIGKDGVPQNIEKTFEIFAIEKLKKLLDIKKNNDFVFTNSKGIPLHSTEFSKILFKYTGEHFYPYIIRSYHADTLCKEFIETHTKSTKKEVENKFLEIASDLGHKKFNKKKNEWQLNYKITIENYIRPQYSQKMISFYKK